MQPKNFFAKNTKYFLVFFAFALIFVCIFSAQPVSAAVCDITPGITCAQVCGDISPGTPACAVGGVADGTCPATYTCIARPLCSAPGGPVLSFCSYNGGTGDPHYQCVNGQCIPSSTSTGYTSLSQCQASCGGGSCGYYVWPAWPANCPPGTTQTRWSNENLCGNKISQTRNCGCAAPKEDKNGICCNPDQVNYNGVCCKPDCTGKQCTDSSCGQSCASPTAAPLSGVVDIVINKEYADTTRNLKFFEPKIEDLNPFDTIDCILKGYPQTSDEIKGKLILDTGTITQTLKEGTLSWNGGEYVWTLDGGTGWGRKLFDDPLVNTVPAADRKIKCVVTKKCGPTGEKEESPKKHVSLCVHVWGGDAKPDSGPSQRKSGYKVFKFANVGGFGTVDADNVSTMFDSAGLKSYIENKNISPISNNLHQFEFYADLKQINDANLVYSRVGNAPAVVYGEINFGAKSECKGMNLYLMETKKFPKDNGMYSDTYSPATYLGFNSFYKEVSFIHEIGHFFRLEDEYVYDTPAVFLNKANPYESNCDSSQICENFKSKFNGYGQGCHAGCTNNNYYRSTDNSVMNVHFIDFYFNKISCAIIARKIIPDLARPFAIQYCNNFGSLAQ